MHPLYHTSLSFQTTFLRDNCFHVSAADIEATDTLKEVCVATSCLEISLTDVRKLSPPSPYTARFLAANPLTKITAHSFLNIDQDICHHPLFLTHNSTLLLSKINVQSSALPSRRNLLSTADSAETENPISTTRIFCAITTFSPNHLLATAAAELWGSQCSGLVVYSNATDWQIPSVTLRTPPGYEESYANIWHKFAAIYVESYQSYGQDFDYFFFGDDDSYVIVPNLFYFVETNENLQWFRREGKGIYAGRPIYNVEYDFFFNTGGGFLLDQIALQALAEGIGEREHGGHIVDVYIADILRSRSINSFDTRDSMGADVFHHYAPDYVYSYTGEEGGDNFYKYYSYKFIAGRDGCSSDSVVFHKIVQPESMRVIHATLHECSYLLSK